MSEKNADNFGREFLEGVAETLEQQDNKFAGKFDI